MHAGARGHDQVLAHGEVGKDAAAFRYQRQAFANRAFRLVTLTYLGAWLTIQLVQGNLFIYARDWLGMPDQDFGFVLLALQFTAFLAMLVWARVSASSSSTFQFLSLIHI